MTWDVSPAGSIKDSETPHVPRGKRRRLRRSLLMYDALNARATPDTFDRTVESFIEIGPRESVVVWPRDDKRALLERAAAAAIPRLRS
jgi:hypothetical protein